MKDLRAKTHDTLRVVPSDAHREDEDNEHASSDRKPNLSWGSMDILDHGSDRTKGKTESFERVKGSSK